MFKHLIFLFTSHTLCALTTLTITLSSDNNPGGNGDIGDLRYCLNSMNQDLNTTADDYEIIFDFPMTIQLNGILPIINNSSNPVNITIGNPGSLPTVTIDGNSGAYSGFFIPTGNVTIQNVIFQNLSSKGGDGGNGISGGGGGLGAGGAIYAPQSFLNGSYPSITLINVTITDCSAVGGQGGNSLPSTGNEGGGGGGGFSGNGGSVTASGITGGGGGGGFGGDGGDVTLSTSDSFGGGGGGGGGIGSRAAAISPLTNLGNGGADNNVGQDGNGYGLLITAGSGAGGNSGGIRAGGGGGGGGTNAGGGGGGSSGMSGMLPQGALAPGGGILPSGGYGGDGGGGGGAGIVITNSTNGVDGQAGSGGYGGGGGGGAGTGAYDTSYTVQGGLGGLGGGGGGGGVNQSGTTSAEGGGSLGGGGGGGGGPSNGLTALGGSDSGNLGGGSGGNGSDTYGLDPDSGGGGGGGGGSALGGAIFVDSNLNFTIQAFPGIPTTFNTSNTTTQAGTPGTGSHGGTNGFDGSALGNSIFLRSGSSLTFIAQDVNDLLTLGAGVAFTDDTSFGAGGTNIFVRGNGTVIYNGTTDYLGTIMINNANFQVNGEINEASILVCRNISFSSQRGTLSGGGILTGDVYVNSGIISPNTAETLTLGSLILNPADLLNNTLGSLVHIEIDSSSIPSVVTVTGPTSLAGTLEIDLDPNANPGTYTILTSSAITGTFDFITFTRTTPNYSISYLPIGNPTFVQLNFLGYLQPPSYLKGWQKKNDFGLQYELYNQLTWMPSPSSETIGYFIYRDGNKIANVSASTHSYKDHNREKGVSYFYAVTAYNLEGNESSPATITLTP